uniref:CSON014606 protein n=1 Tax=Culicoides sonorensis TaxID=179676 RepID=A0A336MBA4_CULSO
MECDVSPADYLQQQQQQTQSFEEKDPLELQQLKTEQEENHLQNVSVETEDLFKQDPNCSGTVTYDTPSISGVITTISGQKIPTAVVVDAADHVSNVEKNETVVSQTPRHTHHLRKPVPKPQPLVQNIKSNSNHHHHHPHRQKSTNIAAEQNQASTMREVLASIPGFNIKPSRRSKKKMSTAAQLAQTHEGCIDLETPDSILVGTNLRALLNNNTFSILPPLYQHKLIQLLPSVDRPTDILINPEPPVVPQSIELKSSSLNNEFFNRACLEWRDRLAEGEFTPENQVKLKTEAEKEKSKLDPWKLKHFEPIWGEKGKASTTTNFCSSSTLKSEVVKEEKQELDRPALKTTIKLRPTTSIASSSTATPSTLASMIKTSPVNYTTTTCVSVTSPKRTRTIGAMTRSSAAVMQQTPSKSPSAVPDLLPIRTKPLRSLYATSATDTPLNAMSENENQQQQTIKTEIDESDSNNRLSYPVNNLKRSLSTDNDEGITAKVYKAEKRSEQTMTITSYEQNNERKHEITLQESTSMDSEQYSETSNPQNPSGFIFDESSGTPSENNKSAPVSNFSENSQLENLNEADLFYKSDKSSPDESPQIETTEDGQTIEQEDIQYIYQSEVSCGANEDISASVEPNSNSSGTSNSNTTTETENNCTIEQQNHQLNDEHHYQQSTFHHTIQQSNMHHIDNNQIEIVNCDNLGDIMQQVQDPQNSTPDEPSIISGETQRDTITMEELGIRVHNEEIVADQDATADELMPSIQNMDNIQLDDPDQMDEHLTDAVNYVLESGEMAEETIESSLSVPVEEDVKPQVYEMAKNYNAITTSSQGITLISQHPSIQVAHIQDKQMHQAQVQQHAIQQKQLQQQQQALSLKHMNVDGNTFIVPSANEYVTYDKQGSTTSGSNRYQNVRIIQQPGESSRTILRSQSPQSLTSAQEQILQAEILFEAPATAEAKPDLVIERSQGATDMEVSSSMISTNSNQSMHNIRTEQLCDANSLVNVIPTSMGAGGGNMGLVSSGGNIIVATSNSIRTPINTSQFSTICIPSSAGVPIQTSNTGTTKAIQLNHNFLIQKQQQPQNQQQQIHHHIAPTQVPTTAIQQLNNKMPKQIIYTHHPTTIVKQENTGATLQQGTAYPKQKIIMSSANIQQKSVTQQQQQQQVTLSSNNQAQHLQQQQQQQITIPQTTRTTAFAQRVTHQTARLPGTQQVTVRPQKKDSNSINSIISNKGRGGRTNNSGGRPPPGAVNLERSYQICQAVILNSPNRHQLKAQLRPPQEFLASAAAAKNKNHSNSESTTTTSTTVGNKNILVTKTINSEKEKTQYGNVTSSNKSSRPQFQQKKTYIQRQQSPNLIVRQVYQTPGTNNTGTVVAANPTQHVQRINLQSISNPSSEQHIGTASIVNNGNGQYVLVQRTGIIQESGQQRASSAPPSSRLAAPTIQNQIHGINGIPLNIAGRGRPASVDIDTNISDQSPNPGVQAVTRRGPNQGIPYSDASTDPNLQNFAVTGENSNSSSASSLGGSSGIGVNSEHNCHCSLNAMVICQQCGAFTHEDCQKQKLCVACVIR